MSITLTDNFVKQLKFLRKKEEIPTLMLRIQVNGGGCQGFEYEFIIETTPSDNDHVFEKDGAGILVDDISLPFIKGAQIDYIDDLVSAQFKVINPNANSSCGCGTSFSV